ncbi:hypothetical protein [Oceanobacillus iheyensis HTE831]|uniref:Uncharacterized protein n=1 Tax=Oceanobacillus iheyensis (strain DSM 14371 / CIP 107618 / JCM 11309 / KCTC 3954 / HTE831) TaxID=221109 RepID=Q8ERI5_OCEIH|nr:DUF5082 domain-containing protein [Oceanobacillus iheyensis]BAC13273.1 hypothetical protein [Oceanobacillus iheyensis HTE831]
MTSLSQLYGQKRTVLSAMADTKNNISALEDKITRLRIASSQMDATNSNLYNLNNSIQGILVNNSNWNGKEENNYNEAYSNYKDSTRHFVTKSEEVKINMDEDIQRYELEKTSLTTGLNNLETSLGNLEWQISQLEKE